MDWKIAKSQRVCTCGRQLEENETYFAALYEDGESFIRREYCVACWEKARAEAAPFSFWKTSVPTREQKRRLLADDEVLLNFFFRLENDPDEQHQRFLYLLALILMRKKVLKFHDIEHADDREILCLRYAPEDRIVRVPNPKLSEEQIEGLKEQLTEILDIDV